MHSDKVSVYSIGRGLGRRLDNATAKQLAVRITIFIWCLIWEYNIISVCVKLMNGNANILHSQIDHHMWMSTVNTSILFVNILFLIFMLYILYVHVCQAASSNGHWMMQAAQQLIKQTPLNTLYLASKPGLLNMQGWFTFTEQLVMRVSDPCLMILARSDGGH